MNISMHIVSAAIALFLCGASGSAQKPEPVPVQVIWKSGAENITISEAKDSGVRLEGASSPSSSKAQGPISIECFFKEKDFAEAFPEGAEYDVRWYYYMSTRKMLISSKIISVSAKSDSKDGLVSLVCDSKQNPRPGWWEVQIQNRQSGTVITYADQDTYQILLK